MKICIVGTGKIVAEVLLMLKEELANEIEVTGIYSREKSVEKTQAMLEKTGCQVPIYTDYQRMLQEAESDFVYIANANHVHYQYAMQAMTSGHNVIVEKPIARNRVETEEMFDKALMHGVYCLPAYSLLYMPLLRKIIEVLPQIGQVRMVNCFYAQYSSRYDKYLRGEVEPVFDPQCSGGSLMDLDVYNLCFCIALFHKKSALNTMWTPVVSFCCTTRASPPVSVLQKTATVCPMVAYKAKRGTSKYPVL